MIPAYHHPPVPAEQPQKTLSMSQLITANPVHLVHPSTLPSDILNISIQLPNGHTPLSLSIKRPFSALFTALSTLSPPSTGRLHALYAGCDQLSPDDSWSLCTSLVALRGNALSGETSLPPDAHLKVVEIDPQSGCPVYSSSDFPQSNRSYLAEEGVGVVYTYITPNGQTVCLKWINKNVLFVSDSSSPLFLSLSPSLSLSNTLYLSIYLSIISSVRV